MADRTQNVTLDGTGNFSIWGRDYTWGSNYVEHIGAEVYGPDTSYELNITTKGKFYSNGLRFRTEGATYDININDNRKDADYREFGAIRVDNLTPESTFTAHFRELRSDDVYVGNATADVTVSRDGEIGRFRSNDGDATVTVQDGGRISTIHVGMGNNTVTTGDRFVGFISNWEGKATVTVGSGGVGHIKLGEGTNVVKLEGYLESYFTHGSAVTRMTSEGGDVGAVQSGDGNDRIDMRKGDASTVETRGGNDTILGGDGGFNFIRTGDGRDTVTLGNGGAESIQTEDGNDKVTINGGYVTSLRTGEGKDTVTINSGGAESIRTDDGNDRVILKGDYVPSVRTGDGNDKVTVNGSGLGRLSMGDGNDTLTLIQAPNAGQYSGGGGNDTLNLKGLGTALTVNFNSYAFENIGAPGADRDAEGIGFFLFFSFEKVIGTDFHDTFVGADTLEEHFIGGKGNDDLSGGKGGDTLEGGKGNDVLTGGDDADLFRFRKGDGKNDTITDFEVGIDQIDFIGAKGMGALKFAKVGSDVRISYANVKVLVEDVRLSEMRDADNFDF